MRVLSLFALTLSLAACRQDGETKYVPDRDADGLNEDEDCDDSDPDVGLADTWYADADGDGHGDPDSGDSYCERPEGYSDVGDDCDDTQATIYPGADDICDDLDNDCDGVVDNGLESTAWYTDLDGDGYGDDASETWDCAAPDGAVDQGGDCDDADPAYNPGATEEDCEDPADYNCDGFVGYTDNDGDGYAACAECDDGDPAVNPDALEVCNDVDDDCDTLTDDDDDSLDASAGVTVYLDLDADGYGDPAVSALVCDPGPGWVLDATDCDDSRPDIHPAATEVCNGLDDDCDTLVDDADASLDPTSASTWYTDADGDPYGDDTTAQLACDAPAGTVAVAGDCDDADAAYNPGAAEADCADPADYNCDGSTGYADADSDGWAACEECDDTSAAVFPGATEVCNGADDDCDGTVDEADATDASTWYADGDSDGYGDAASTTVACDAPAGYLADATDCDDTDAAVNPAQVEVCNGIDDDCDGSVDGGAADASTWYADADADGYGDAGSTTTACDAPAGSVADHSDCDDTDAAVNPSAIELCDGLDNDCDGDVDEDSATDAPTWYADTDGDGYGDSASAVVDCDTPAGYVADDTDCDDSESDVYPGAVEACDGEDDDCDGAVDEGVTTEYYADVDGDGYGDAGSTTDACAAPAGYVADATDCDDADASSNPGEVETCDGTDNDCDGTTDEGVTTEYYADADGDGYGDAGSTTDACSAPAGYVADATDCDDGDASSHPGGTETCDGADNDCDGTTDEGVTTVYYVDADGDGYGDASATTSACSTPSGYATTDDDCDDTDAGVNPGEADVCDTVDNDCDGSKDEDGLCPCDVEEYGGHVYMFCTSASTWTAGETECLTYGYDYAAVNDSSENDFVNNQAFLRFGGKWWVGLTDAASEGTWVWSNGDAVSYTNWASGEPNDSGGNEDCTQLGRYYPSKTWNDEPCSSTFRFICEE